MRLLVSVRQLFSATLLDILAALSFAVTACYRLSNHFRGCRVPRSFDLKIAAGRLRTGKRFDLRTVTGIGWG